MISANSASSASKAASQPGSGSTQRGFDIDFNAELPLWDFFAVYYLAQRWHVTTQHVFNLIDSGELKVGVDLRNKASSRSTIRVPRKSLVEFLNRRKDLAAVAAANPQPKPRKFAADAN